MKNLICIDHLINALRCLKKPALDKASLNLSNANPEQ
jgi:hypothetical protein